MLRLHRQLARRYSFSFIPTANVSEFESLERTSRENDAAVPPRPDFSHRQRIYNDIVSPKDVCDVVLKPAFEDVLVTSLARNSPVSGNLKYQLVTKGSVKSTNLMFAKLTAEWMADLNKQNPELKEYEAPQTMSYKNTAKEKTVAEKYTAHVLSDYASVHQFYLEFDSDISIENITLFLLTKSDSVQTYKHIMKHVGANVHMLSPFALGDFLGVLLDDLNSANSFEKVDVFDTFFNGSLLATYNDALRGLSVPTLDKLAYVLSSLLDLSTARDILAILVEIHRLAPRRATFELFTSRYSKAVGSKTKEEILVDLAPLKPIFFHHGLDSTSFRLLLSRTIDNVYDLSHFVKLVASTSPHLLQEHGLELVERLAQVQEGSNLIKAVQIRQLHKTLADNGCSISGETKARLDHMYGELGVQSA